MLISKVALNLYRVKRGKARVNETEYFIDNYFLFRGQLSIIFDYTLFPVVLRTSFDYAEMRRIWNHTEI